MPKIFKIYRRIQKIPACNLLQKDVDSVQRLSEENTSTPNLSECGKNDVYKKNNLILNKWGYELKSVERVKDLGVLSDSKLTFTSCTYV